MSFFSAEKVQASTNRVYHKKCCTCNSCNQRLDPGTLCNGSDQEIYCQPCHARKFGGASFRGSMAATWVDAEAASNMRPCQGIDPSKLKIENQQGNNNNKCDTHAFQKKICVILYFLMSHCWHVVHSARGAS